MPRIRRILFPTDFSQSAKAALPYAQALAEQNDAELHILHVMPDIGYLFPTPVLGVPSTINFETIRAGAEVELSTAVDPAWAAKHPVSRYLRAGSPYVEIIRLAKEDRIDLIVMSTHGRTGLSHLLLGSVAENVVRQAPCPVLTVPPAGHQFVAP